MKEVQQGRQVAQLSYIHVSAVSCPTSHGMLPMSEFWCIRLR